MDRPDHAVLNKGEEEIFLRTGTEAYWDVYAGVTQDIETILEENICWTIEEEIRGAAQ